MRMLAQGCLAQQQEQQLPLFSRHLAILPSPGLWRGWWRWQGQVAGSHHCSRGSQKGGGS